MRRTHHVGLTVSDVERSVAFYHDLLGLELDLAPTDWAEDDHLPEALGVAAPVKMRLAAFRIDAQTLLEVLEYALPPSERGGALIQNNVGACHVAMQIDDIDTLVRDLRARDVPFNSVAHDIDEGPFAGWRWVYFKDPDGHTIEFVEIRYPGDEEQRERDVRDYLAARGEAPPQPTG